MQELHALVADVNRQILNPSFGKRVLDGYIPM